MSVWLLGILIWVCAGTLITFLTRRSMARYYIEVLKVRDEASDSEPYQRGFKDGAMGIKMYFTIVGKMPDSYWVLTNCMKRLDTREKLLETLDEDQLKSIIT